MQPLVRAGTAVVRAASAVRGERAIHPRGRTLVGSVTTTGGGGTGVALLDAPGRYDAVVRVSRSAGLPEALPDVLGLAVRLLDAHGPGRHQDVLLDSTRPEPWLRRWPVPARHHLSVLHGSLLPYDVPAGRLLLGARGRSGQPEQVLSQLPDELEWELLLATPHGPWRTWGVLRTSGLLPAPQGRALRFNPWTTGGGLVPAGPFQQWRRRAYEASHVGPDS